MDSFIRDLRFAVRGLARTPGFTIAAVLALALGIGATTAIFSVVHAALLASLGWGEETRLVSVLAERRLENLSTLSPPEVFDLRSVPQFESSGGFTNQSAVLQGERPERVRIGQVTSGFFEALGVRPVYGRTIAPEEDMKGKSGVALVSAPAWRRRFGGDPAAVGRWVTLDGEPYQVVGVLPDGFTYSGAHDFFIPFGFPEAELASWRGATWIEGVARLRPGVSVEAARSALGALSDRLRQQYPDAYPKEVSWSLRLEPLRDRFVGSMKQPLFILFGAVLLVLLIACANVANLLLARSAAREREFAVRAAIGAGRARIVRQLLTEGFAIALAGTVLGVLLAAWGLDVLLATAPRRLLELGDVRVNRAVLGVAVVLTMATTVLFALLPALRASQVDVASALKDGAHGSAGVHAVRLRSALVAGQVAISLVLLAGAGLMLRSFATLLHVSPGFEAEGAVAAILAPAGPAYEDDGARRRYFEEALHAAGAVPGVQSAGGIDRLPATGSRYSLTYFIEGYEPAPGEPQPSAQIRRAMPGHFAALKQRVVAGREFTAADDARSPLVALVNEAWVRRYFPGRDVVGRRIRLDSKKNGEWRTIVGVVADAREFGLDRPAPPVYYFDALQDPAPDMMSIVARGRATPAALRDALSRVDPTQPLENVLPVTEILASSLKARRFPLQLLGAFAVLALVLSALGIYGITAYAVAQRTREIGLRMAIGASPLGVVRMVLGASLRVVLLGLCAGIAGALAGARLIASQLYGVSARDPLTLAAIGGLLAAVAVVASVVPALRAARIDPMAALRTE